MILAITTRTDYLFDDLSLEGSFGNRRLQLKMDTDKEYPLYPLKRAIWSLGNLVLYSKLYNRFVDSEGRIFNYKPQFFVPLIYRKILKSKPYKNGVMLLLENVHCPIWLYRPLNPGEEYAALLVIEQGYLLLGVTTQPNSKRSRFKI